MLGRRAHGQHPPRSTSLPALPACPQLRPYQRRALAHMLREERAEGGASRHLWVKFNLPTEPGGGGGGRAGGREGFRVLGFREAQGGGGGVSVCVFWWWWWWWGERCTGCLRSEARRVGSRGSGGAARQAPGRLTRWTTRGRQGRQAAGGSKGRGSVAALAPVAASTLSHSRVKCSSSPEDCRRKGGQARGGGGVGAKPARWARRCRKQQQQLLYAAARRPAHLGAAAAAPHRRREAQAAVGLPLELVRGGERVQVDAILGVLLRGKLAHLRGSRSYRGRGAGRSQVQSFQNAAKATVAASERAGGSDHRDHTPHTPSHPIPTLCCTPLPLPCQHTDCSA